MYREWLMSARILTGVCVLAASSFSQTYTISAKPGAVNFIQGEVTVNGDPVWTANLKSTFLKANDVIAVKNGKAEVLLTPGVFLRLGQNSEVRMVKPSLIETQVEVLSGESMIEVDDAVPGSSVAVLDHGSSTTLAKTGLYRFTGTTVAVLDGKADVTVGDRTVELKKDRELNVDEKLHATKVDLNQPDDLYAWSNQRAQYDAAATYAGAKDVYNNVNSGYSSSFNSPGWYWNSPFNSFMWLPGNGAFYSPFGWGFYGPGVVAFAPVMAYPFYVGSGYGYYGGGYYGGNYPARNPVTTATATKPPVQVYVPVNPKNVGIANFQGSSPAGFAAARGQMQQAVGFYGLHTAAGAPAAVLPHGQTFSSPQAAARAASAHPMTSARSSGGFSAASSSSPTRSGGFSSPAPMSAPAAHASSGSGHK